MHNGKYDIAFPEPSETQNLVMINKMLDIYILLYFCGRLRSLAILLDKCLLILYQIISQKINFLCKLSVVTQILEFSVSLVSPRISLSAETRMYVHVWLFAYVI